MIPCEAWLRYNQKKIPLTADEVNKILGDRLKDDF